MGIFGMKRKIKAGKEMSEQERGGSEGGQGPLNVLRVLSNVLFGVLTSTVPVLLS